MKDNPKLKPCPFCGGEIRADIENMPEDRVTWYKLWCKNEGCVLSEDTDGYFDNKKELVEAWNKRS